MSAPWHDDARALIDSGLSARAVAAQLGKSEHAVRYALDIGGCRDKTKARIRKLRARRRAEGYSQRRDLARSKPEILDNQVLRTYGDSTVCPRQMVITLPKISMPDLAEPRAPLKFAPRTRWSSTPGAERIRAVHHKMIREGKIPAADLVSEWRQ
jgi:hypothetical protein